MGAQKPLRRSGPPILCLPSFSATSLQSARAGAERLCQGAGETFAPPGTQLLPLKADHARLETPHLADASYLATGGRGVPRRARGRVSLFQTRLRVTAALEVFSGWRLGLGGRGLPHQNLQGLLQSQGRVAVLAVGAGRALLGRPGRGRGKPRWLLPQGQLGPGPGRADVRARRLLPPTAAGTPSRGRGRTAAVAAGADHDLPSPVVRGRRVPLLLPLQRRPPVPAALQPLDTCRGAHGTPGS